MSAKMQALVGEIERMKRNEPMYGPTAKMRELLAKPYFISDPTDLDARVLPDEALPCSEEVIRLREIKSLLEKVSGACGEALKEAEAQLFKIMSTKGPSGFSHQGRRFAMSSTNYVQADKEQGGTGNPELKQWLVDNGMPDVAEGTINANTLKASVNTWLEDHPIEVIVNDSPLEDEALLEALGLDVDGFQARVNEHARLLSMVRVSTEPTLSVTKV